MGTSTGKPFVHIFGPLTELNGQEENKVADHINKGWKLETIVGIFITLAGIILVPDPRTFYISSKETVGNLMGLCAGFCYAAMALSAKPVLKNTSGYYAVFWQHLIGTIMFLFFIDAESFYGLYANWWQLLVIGILCTGIAFLLFMEGIKKVKAQKIFIVTTLEPLAGTIAALIVLSEVPSLLTIIGAVLIMYGIYRVTRKVVA